MSVVSGFDYASNIPAEPFGQAGVRKYFGRILLWVFLTIGLSAAALAHRSQSYSDWAKWVGHSQTMRVSSSSGQLSIIAMPELRGDRPDSGWSFGGNVGRRGLQTYQGWQSDLNELLGFEYQSPVPGRYGGDGVWLRVKWSTLAVLFLIQPLVYVVRLWFTRRRRRAAENADD